MAKAMAAREWREEPGTLKDEGENKVDAHQGTSTTMGTCVYV